VEHASTLGTVGDIALVDLSQYLLIDKGGMNSASSIHVRFLNDEMTFKFTLRIDGQPIWNSALTPAKGSNTQSPFVVLATRA
jgi:HK97 family phage major capsid protein